MTAPILQDGGSAQFLALLGIAIATGAAAFSVNDNKFWLVNRYFGMDTKQTLRCWTLLTASIGFTGFLVALVLGMVLG